MGTNVDKSLKGIGVSLEKQAAKSMGSFAQDQVAGALKGLFGSNKNPNAYDGIWKDGVNAETAVNNAASLILTQDRDTRVWDPTKYGLGGDFTAKNNFLFKVGFKFAPEIIDAALNYGIDSASLSREFTAIVKDVELPKLSYEYEDVNMYNFKTQVLKTINNNDISVSFYDDIGNRGLHFVNLLTLLNSPVSRGNMSPNFDMENYGFTFATEPSQSDSAIRGVLPGFANQVVSEMIIEQYYVIPSSDKSLNPITQTFMNRWTIVNPRIKTVELPHLDYANSQETIIKFGISFDAFGLSTVIPGSMSKTPSVPGHDLLMDVTGELEKSKMTKTIRGYKKPDGKWFDNKYLDAFAKEATKIVARQGQKIVQETVANKLRNSKLGKLAGGELLGGAIGAAGSGLGTAFSNGISSLVGPKVKDNG